MPYVSPDRQAEIDGGSLPVTEGDLNYAISKLMIRYYREHRHPGYAAMSETRAAALDAAEEWYRRVMAPYEDAKAALPGRDIYDWATSD